jgi:hypothetical protein
MTLIRFFIAAALVLTLARTADADPVTIRTGWVVATSGYSPLSSRRRIC